MSVMNGPVNGPTASSGHTPHSLQGTSDYPTSSQSGYLNRSHGSAFISSLLPNSDLRGASASSGYDHRSTLSEFGFGGGTSPLSSSPVGLNTTSTTLGANSNSPNSTSPQSALLQAVKLRQQHSAADIMAGVAGPMLNNENEFPSLAGGIGPNRGSLNALNSHYGGSSGSSVVGGGTHGMLLQHNSAVGLSMAGVRSSAYEVEDRMVLYVNGSSVASSSASSTLPNSAATPTTAGTSMLLANLMKSSEIGGPTIPGVGINSGQGLHINSKEFRIQNEDFPALPGSETSANSAATGAALTSSQTLLSQQQNSSFPGSSGVVGPSRNTADLQRQQETSMTRGIQTHPDGTVTEIPGQMLNDQFGMVGLLSSLRAIYSDQRVVSLTLGQDMTTLGLDLNSPDKTLYQNFGGPWSDAPLRTQDLEWCSVPQEYQVGAVLKDKLAGVKLNRCPEDTLFYLFYQSTQEIYQMAAAAELYSRDWRYHKLEKVWLTRSVRQATEQGRNFERGFYYVFDQYAWTKVQKEMKLEYQMLEERPKFPLGPPTPGAPGGGSGAAPGAPLPLGPPGATTTTTTAVPTAAS